MEIPKNAVLTLHGLTGLMQLLMAIFGLLGWLGNNVMDGWGWLAFFLVTYVLDIVEMALVFLSNDAKTKGRSYAMWHLIHDIVYGILFLLYFVQAGSASANIQSALVNTFSAVREQSRWTSLVVSLTPLWLVDLHLLYNSFIL